MLICLSELPSFSQRTFMKCEFLSGEAQLPLKGFSLKALETRADTKAGAFRALLPPGNNTITVLLLKHWENISIRKVFISEIGHNWLRFTVHFVRDNGPLPASRSGFAFRCKNLNFEMNVSSHTESCKSFWNQPWCLMYRSMVEFGENYISM